MNKPLRYLLAVLACTACYGVCIALMVATGVGGVLAMVLMCFAIKHVWNAIVHYEEDSESDNIKQENGARADESNHEFFDNQVEQIDAGNSSAEIGG